MTCRRDCAFAASQWNRKDLLILMLGLCIYMTCCVTLLVNKVLSHILSFFFKSTHARNTETSHVNSRNMSPSKLSFIALALLAPLAVADVRSLANP